MHTDYDITVAAKDCCELEYARATTYLFNQDTISVSNVFKLCQVGNVIEEIYSV